MNILKKRISLILSIIMLAMVIVPIVNINAATCQVTMTAKMTMSDGSVQTLKNNTRYRVVGGEKVVINSSSSVTSMAFVGYYFAPETAYENRTKVQGGTATITIPKRTPGTLLNLLVEPVASNDDGSDNTVTKTGWQKYTLEYVEPEDITTPITGKNITVKFGSTVLANKSTTTVKAGDKIVINANPINKASTIWYKWTDVANKSVNAGTYTFTIPSDVKPGQTYSLMVNAVYADGLYVDGKDSKNTVSNVYYFKIPNSATQPTEPDNPVVAGKDLIVKYGSTTLSNGSTTTVKVGDEIVVKATPTADVSKIWYKWASDAKQSVSSSTYTLTIPSSAKAGQTYSFMVNAIYSDGLYVDGKNSSNTTSEVYYFKVSGSTSVVDKDDLDIEPWMEENDEITDLSISLRNDSEEEDKANKNIYELDEVVTYYVDYKNGGKDINGEVSITLELPLDFKAVSLDGGKINSDDEIEWNFADGLKEGEAGTLIVKVKYTDLKRAKDDANTIYPTAKIYKGSKVKDVSSVINFIITSYDEEIDIDHEPYMYGDADDDTFRPDYLITRAEGALVLARIYGLDYENIRTITTKYTDIDTTYLEAQKAITAASQAGLINGYLEEDGTYTYRPNSKMTKAEFMKILACMIQESADDEGIDGLEIKELENLVKVYDDSTRYYVVNGKKVYTHWAIEEITLLARLNMLPLTEDDPEFELDEKITRAEVAQLINFYLLRAPAEVTSKTKTGFSDVSRKHDLVGDIVEATRKEHTFSITENALEVEE